MSDHDTWNMLPCPFCGEDNAMMLPPTCRPETPYNPADRLFPIVRCGSCCAEVSGQNEDYRCLTAIAAWNRRAPAEPTPPQPDDDGWIKHRGGPMPVSGETKVIFRFKNGEEDGPSPAHEADWGPGWGDYTITAYRIASEAGVTK